VQGSADIEGMILVLLSSWRRNTVFHGTFQGRM
jgi:hypothetical protein